MIEIKVLTANILKSFYDKICEIFAKKDHVHAKSQISDFPSSLPANGGRADSADKLNTTLYCDSGGDNSNKYKLIASQTISAWMNRRCIYLVKSRHTGAGLLILSTGCNSDTASNDTIYGELRYFGPSSNAMIYKDSYQLYCDGSKVYLFQKYWDYSFIDIILLSGDIDLEDGEWMSSIDSKYGTLKASTEINVADSVDWSNVVNKPDSYPANGGNSSTVNDHTVESDVPANAKFVKFPIGESELSSNFIDNFKTITRGDNANYGTYLSILRNNTANVQYAPQYGTGIAFGVHDTHTYLYTSYLGPEAYIGGGNADNLQWVRRLLFYGDTPTVVNNLTTNTTGSVLDAYQGKVLNDKISALSDAIVSKYFTGYANIHIKTKCDFYYNSTFMTYDFIKIKVSNYPYGLDDTEIFLKAASSTSGSSITLDAYNELTGDKLTSIAAVYNANTSTISIQYNVATYKLSHLTWVILYNPSLTTVTTS